MWPAKRALIDICLLLITSMGGAKSNYLLEFDVTLDPELTNFTRMKVGYDKPKDNAMFTSCLCGGETKCTTIAFKTIYPSPSGTGYKNMTLDFSPSNNSGPASYFVCSILPTKGKYEMSCQYKTSDSITCRTGPCSVNIKMPCPQNKTVFLIWSMSQQALVYEGYDVTLEDCCPATQATTNDLATTITTSTTTTIPTSTIGTTTFSNTAVSEQTTLQEYTPTIQTTKSSITSPSTTPTSSTDSASPIQDQQNGSASQITDVHIGIIVGTAVAAIIITVIIMCVIWKIKTRSYNNPPSKSNGSKLGSTNQTTSPKNAVRNETKTNKTNQQQPQPVSLQPVSNINQEYNEISQYYNSVDAASTVIPSNTDRSVPAELSQNSVYSNALETPEDTNPSVYSHLRENNAIPANVYNIGPNEQDATITNRANLTDASQNSDLNKTTTIKPAYSTIEHPNPGIPKTKKKQKRSIPVQYTEIDPTKKLNNGVTNHKPQTANDQASRDDQILPDKQTKQNNSYYDIELPDPNQILPNQQTKPNNNYFEIELPEPDHVTADDQVTLASLYSIAVYSPEEDMEDNNTIPMKETDTIYFNAV